MARVKWWGPLLKIKHLQQGAISMDCDSDDTSAEQWLYANGFVCMAYLALPAPADLRGLLQLPFCKYYLLLVEKKHIN